MGSNIGFNTSYNKVWLSGLGWQPCLPAAGVLYHPAPHPRGPLFTAPPRFSQLQPVLCCSPNLSSSQPPHLGIDPQRKMTTLCLPAAVLQAETHHNQHMSAGWGGRGRKEKKETPGYKTVRKCFLQSSVLLIKHQLIVLYSENPSSEASVEGQTVKLLLLRVCSVLFLNS